MEWAQDENGTEQNPPTDTLLVTPPLLELQPGTSRALRVAISPAKLATLSRERETSYRVVLNEVREEASESRPGAVINVAVNLFIPVFITPKQVDKQALQLSPDSSTRKIIFSNPSNVHIRIKEWRIESASGEVAYSVVQPATLLAGARRAWEIPAPAVERIGTQAQFVVAVVGNNTLRMPLGVTP